MKGSLTLWFSFVFAYLFCSCKATTVFKNYFPLQGNKVITYEKVVDSTNTTSVDTLICREVIAKTKIKSSYKRIRLADADLDNYIVNGKVNIYYFEKTILDSISVYRMRDSSFAERLYCFKKGRLYVSYGWTKAMDYDSEMELLFPKKLELWHDYKHKNGDYWKSFRYVGKETITANNVLYKNCLKIDIYETLGASKKTGTVWFAKGIGMVKREIKNEIAKYIYEYEDNIPPGKP